MAVTILFAGIAGPECTFAQKSTPDKRAQEFETPARKIDRTGIKWVMPFSAALETAKQENRILAIKMIAFGSDSTGCW